ncbi:GNAT family N-acetyltransferase [Methanosphaera sp. WGK6]|uniref:GNAT family N-acetyltransferase n=1 Tax=Methanosphaera sp. WGK6 TaxID=1561964 RepID=UPI00084CA59C|nr:GNAT family N-acetyltransferase [Methanosphaera sp. WGK6]OED29933.1 GNAT family acetyltransferase [Methanosphaera sp. WGK6]
MNIEIRELNRELIDKYNVKEFLFYMIKMCYKMDYVPEYHYDIINLEEYYIKPKKNTFYLSIDKNTNTLIGTSAIRAYDKDYHIKNRNYTKETTASIYRVFVNPKYRRCKIATRMLEKIENFCIKENYNEIYLHTQKDSCGALPFWLNNNYIITENTHNQLGTIHMEKNICSK